MLENKKIKGKYNYEIAGELRSFINTKQGWVITKMMRNHLLRIFKERLEDKNVENLRLSTINSFNIRRILWAHLDYTGENENKEHLNRLVTLPRRENCLQVL